MGKTTNILDLNNRLEKVEKEKVAQNNYNSLKNRPKINGNLLTGDKTGAQLGLAEAQDIGDLSALTTTDKSSAVGAINEVNSILMSRPTEAVKNTDYVGDNFLKVLRIGNLVNVSGRFQVETEKPEGYTNYLFSNLPIPAGATVGVHNNTFESVRLYINNEGYLTCNEVAPTGYYNVSATYSATN